MQHSWGNVKLRVAAEMSGGPEFLLLGLGAPALCLKICS
jgi:hypothetical protein